MAGLDGIRNHRIEPPEPIDKDLSPPGARRTASRRRPAPAG
ncbi:glutamine synthetase [Rothia sp. AR01]|uniref:Glutamine synthetase n=1 Tax=Rothia santali TaxID=2949643 RepID=A0A9X2KI23_9MICC|nr:glutamine synthetase [Rothia santali]MCP3425545.1 glutamine synthetase [Rothia santali]